MDNYKTVETTPTQSERSRKTVGNDQSRTSSRNIEGISTGASRYTVRTQQSTVQTPLATDFTSDSNQGVKPLIYSNHHNQSGKETVKLMPVKVKDVMEILRNNPAYRNKSPVMINVKENDIDQIIEQQRYGNGLRVSTSPQMLPTKSPRRSPISMRRSIAQEEILLRRSLGHEPRSLRQSYTAEPILEVSQQYSGREASNSKYPPWGDKAPQIYAMTDIQAYPVNYSEDFRIEKSPRKKSKKLRRKSSRKITPRRRTKRKKRSKSRKRSRPRSRKRSRPRSRKRSRPRSRKRSRPRSRKRSIPRSKSKPKRQKSRPKRVVKIRSPPRRKSLLVVFNRQPCATYDPICCTSYPVSDYGSSPTYQTPMYTMSKAGIAQPGRSLTCMCNSKLCKEKPRFIQPSVCTKKKFQWTNEYAVIPKPQMNFIDPCEVMDPITYPRANNPCIRDGRGNPLTDCIGRPLRDPGGKKFLGFNAKGSLMDTSLKGNFYSGQPPVCVKYPDRTQNCWTTCCYPTRTDINPYF